MRRMPTVCGVDGGARPEEHERHAPGRCKEAQRTCVGERGGKCTGGGARAQHVSLVPEQQRAPGRGGTWAGTMSCRTLPTRRASPTCLGSPLPGFPFSRSAQGP